MVEFGSLLKKLPLVPSLLLLFQPKADPPLAENWNKSPLKRGFVFSKAKARFGEAEPSFRSLPRDKLLVFGLIAQLVRALS